MKIDIDLLQLRKDLFSRGDNVEVAKLASTKSKKFTAMDVALAARDGRAKDIKLIIAINKFYKLRQTALSKELAQ